MGITDVEHEVSDVLSRKNKDIDDIVKDTIWENFYQDSQFLLANDFFLMGLRICFN
jgi:hypothetical protein